MVRSILYCSHLATCVFQYDSDETLEGLNVNGEFTLGENIGDLGGSSIVFKTYQFSLEGNRRRRTLSTTRRTCKNLIIRYIKCHTN
ncbi:M13-type metalloendopeptidase [Paraglaciecola sp. MB-3u-78]|uniref:M13-type metalloendopeptidase n=1 Tax=Paraglaciecola sp. MB-3u-78 TaxID=2058332 RepID=UPI000C33847C|nr:hypothetical protein CXF95_05405 [Paraglaciecola sp. MB-3u-78]